MKYFIYFILCFLQPICLPFPEATTILLGTETLNPNEAFIIGLIGIMLGITFLYMITFHLSKKYLNKIKKSSKYKTYKRYISYNPILTTGILFSIPIIPDEIICIGAAIGEIPFKVVFPIALFSKIISIGMITYSGNIANFFEVEKWQVIVIELIIMFIAAFIYKIIKDNK